MAVTAAFLEFLKDALSRVGHITVRKMFGGASLYCDGLIFALVDDDVLYLKADDQTKRRFEAEGLKPFTYQGQTGPVSMSYWRAPERLLDDTDEMIAWTSEAVEVARRTAATKTTAKRPAKAKARSSAKSARRIT